MADTKILQAILDGQKALEERLTIKIDQVDYKVDKLDKKIDGVEERLTKRIDNIGLQLLD